MKNNKIILLFTAACMAVGMNAQNPQGTGYSNDGKHRGLDYNLSVGYHFGVGDLKDINLIPVEIGIGKQFHPNLYLGIGSGVWLGTKGIKPLIPIALDAKIMFPKPEASIKPFIGLKFGYLINTQKDETIEYPNSFTLEAMPGIQFPISPKTDFMLSAGYTHQFTSGSGGGYFTVKAGLNFHKLPIKRHRLPREKVNTRDHGWQLTLEGNGNYSEDMGGAGFLVIGYKLNPHFSIGIGGGYEVVNPCKGEGDEDIQIIDPKGNEKYLSYFDEIIHNIKVFARGTYRLTDKRLSPFASIDVGVSKVTADVIYDNLNVFDEEMLPAPNGYAFFAAPAIGLSLRTTKNSYLELKAGCNFSPNLIKGEKLQNEDDYWISCRKINLTAPYISVGFTHTFGKRGKRPSAF